MLMREESVEERTGRQAQATERDGRKPLRKTAIGKYYQEKNEPPPSI
jgi:hypothetical protein